MAENATRSDDRWTVWLHERRGGAEVAWCWVAEEAGDGGTRLKMTEDA
jgi:hypothetical protein